MSGALFSELADCLSEFDPSAGPLSPLEHSESLSRLLGCDVYAKIELKLPSGSFKYRGAAHKLAKLIHCASAGVITASTGNHGAAVAHVGRAVSVPVTAFAPDSASSSKLATIESLGASIVRVPGGALDAERAARVMSVSSGRPYISSYNDIDVIAANAVIAREILDQAPNVSAIFSSVGGGGLLAGVGFAAKHYNPRIRVLGCWPRNADSLYQSLLKGRIVAVAEAESLSDATMGGAEDGAITFPICQSVIDEAILVDEREIADAMRLAFRETGHILEGAAGVALAGLVKRAKCFQGESVAVVLCGGNIEMSRFRRIVQEQNL